MAQDAEKELNKMDLNAYYKAWMQGHKESECIRIGEEAYFENKHQESAMNEHYAELERIHEEETHERNNSNNTHSS